jgi:hypothetical protein
MKAKIVLFFILLFLGGGLLVLSTAAEFLKGYSWILAIAVIVGIPVLCGIGMTAGGSRRGN